MSFIEGRRAVTQAITIIKGTVSLTRFIKVSSNTRNRLPLPLSDPASFTIKMSTKNDRRRHDYVPSDFGKTIPVYSTLADIDGWENTSTEVSMMMC
jgi:hypothetical protein